MLIIGKFIDYSGIRIEKFKVIKRIEDYISPKGHHVARWLCLCDCGNEFITNSNSINNKKVKSCGCLQREVASKLGKDCAYDLIGCKYERLTVIEKVSKPEHLKHNSSYWLCKCECGNSFVATTYQLTSGISKSCGCLTRENLSQINRKYNTYDLSGSFGVGYTTNGEEFYFDLEDYNKIKTVYWRVNPCGYVSHVYDDKNGKTCNLLMHRIIMNPPQNMLIDHINHNKIDNRKCNLRVVDSQKNVMNSSLSKNNKSGVTGVFWNKINSKWASRITYNGEDYHLGYYIELEDAIKARKDAEDLYFGEYSYDNSMKRSEIH